MEDEKLQDKVNVFEKIKKLVKSVSYEDLAKRVGAGVAAALIAATVSGCQPANNSTIITQAQEAVEQEQSDGTVEEFFKTYGIEYTPIDKSVLTSGAELVPTGFDNQLPEWFIAEINDQIFIFHSKYHQPYYSICDIYWFDDRAYTFRMNIRVNDSRIEGSRPNIYFLTNNVKYYENKKIRNDYVISFYGIELGEDKSFLVETPVGVGLIYPINEEVFETVMSKYYNDHFSAFICDEVSKLINSSVVNKDK